MPYRDPEKKRAWQRAHPEKCRAYERRWAEKHPEKAHAARRRYREKHRAPLRVVICGFCNAIFETNQRQKKYCSPYHAHQAYRRRNPEIDRTYRAKHRKRLNRESWERAKRRHARDAEKVRAQRREHQRRYRETHREKIRAANRAKKRREDAYLRSLTTEQVVELVKRKGEHQWPQRLLRRLLTNLRLQLKTP